MIEPAEPPCPPGRRPHKDRVRDVASLLHEGKISAVCIDDTPEHRAWYLHEVAKYPRLEVVDHGTVGSGIYCIKVRKRPAVN